MTDIDIHAKTDRELLIMVVGKLNGLCDCVDRHDKDLNGNGKIGMKAQVRILWLLAGGVWAAFLVLLKTSLVK